MTTPEENPRTPIFFRYSSCFTSFFSWIRHDFCSERKRKTRKGVLHPFHQRKNENKKDTIIEEQQKRPQEEKQDFSPIQADTNILVFCPHCNEPIIIENLTNHSFRHGIYKSTLKQIPLFITDELSADYVKNGLIYGCGKTFMILQDTENCGAYLTYIPPPKIITTVSYSEI